MNSIQARCLTNRAARELSVVFNNSKDEALRRMTPIVTIGRKRGQLHVEKTVEKMEKVLNRFSVVIYSSSNNGFVNTFTVSFVDSAFRLIVFSIGAGIKDGCDRAKMQMIKTNITISRHAVERWLMRNGKDCYIECLHQLGHSLFMCTVELGEAHSSEYAFVNEKLIRQYPCMDGGVSFTAIINPNETDIQGAQLTMLTYISRDMAVDWNREKSSAELVEIDRMERA